MGSLGGRSTEKYTMASLPEKATEKSRDRDGKKKKKSSKRRDVAAKEKAEAFSVPHISSEEIELQQLIGRGCFGKVYSGLCRSMEVAVKVPKKQNLSKRSLRAFIKEVEIMSKIYHPNVCLFMGACTEPGHIRIVSELLVTDLDAKIHDLSEEISLHQRVQWAKETCQGVAWLHGSDPPIVHRDLKPANMLLDSHGTIKVCDFGLSHFMEDGIYDKEPKGTPLYTAPEVMRKEEINMKVDVYSIGIIMWELLTREDPFVEHEDYDAFVDAVCNKNERPIIPRWCPRSLRRVIQDCWQADPELRPTMSDVIGMLDECLVDCGGFDFEQQVDQIIKDRNGRAFWKRNFPSKFSVGWTHFVNAFYMAMQVDAPRDPMNTPLDKNASSEELTEAGKEQLKHFSKLNQDCATKAREELNRRAKSDCSLLYRTMADEGNMDDELRKMIALKMLLKAESTEVVTAEEFGKLLQRLGPLEFPADPENGFLERLADLVCKAWFHGDVPTKETENSLRVCKPGTFLVRFSNSKPDSYCISFVNSGRVVKHLTVPHKSGEGVILGSHTYDTMCALIADRREKMNLLEACPGSRFAWLYESDVCDIGGYGPTPDF